MKITINTQVIEALNPCKDRFDNWKYFYKHRTFDIIEFLDLPHITAYDKIWVAMRVLPRFLVEVFALDAAAHAADAAAAASAYPADAAACAADAADAANDAAADAADAAAAASAYPADAAACAADAADAAKATYAATYTAHAAYIAAAAVTADAANAYTTAAAACAASKERQRQIESLIYLIQTTTNKDMKEYETLY